MKRNLILTVLALSLTITAVAQPKGKECQDVDKKELQAKMMKMKKATFTQNLKLTKEESEKFWPLYEEFEREKNNLIEKQHMKMSKLKEMDILSLDELAAEELIDNEIKMDRMMSEIKVKYYERFKSVLPPQKVAKLMLEEKDLMRKVMKKDCREEKCEEKHGQRPAPNGQKPTPSLKKKPSLSVE